MDERAFQDRYKQAYDRIVPREECIRRLQREKEGKTWQRRIFTIASSGAAAVTAICLLVLIAMPSAVKASPSLYAMVAKYAPALADYCLPTEYSCTSQGITMQVEAINVDGNRTEIVLSFSDAEGGGDMIHGDTEMFGSYGIQGYGYESSIGGCSFLGYDEEEDKAYFKMDLTSFQQIKKSKMVLTVEQLMTKVTEEEGWISMEDMVKNPAVKDVVMFGYSGGSEGYEYFKNGFSRVDDSPQPQNPGYTTRVMDIQGLDSRLADDITVTGIGYRDSVLQVQICRGSSEDAVRHARIFLVDEEDESRIPDFSVGWTEETEGEKLVFDEQWFIIDEEELDNMRMYGIFNRIEGKVKGNWKVTLELE